MILLHPPDPATADAHPPQLSVSRIVRRAFDCGRATGRQPAAAADPELHRFLVDLLAPYGQEPDPQPADHTYAGMVEALLQAPGLLDAPVDLVVLAYAVPDADPRQSAAHVVARLCPGEPLAFALSDQGVAAPFSAIATARAYLRTGGFERALVLILEQPTLPYRAVEPVTLPEHGSAVALVLERSGAMPVVSVDQRMAVAPERVGAVLAAMAAAVSPDPVMVLGPELAGPAGLAGLAGQGRVDGAPVASTGRLGTSVWWGLADVWEDDQPGDGRGVLVAEYDPVAGGVCVLALGPTVSGRRAATTW